MLYPGDTIFRNGTYHHTMMLVNPLNYAGVATLKDAQYMEVIHAATVDSAVYIELLDIEKEEKAGQYFTFYHPENTALRETALAYASLWSFRRGPTGQVTRGQARGKITAYSYDKGHPDVVHGRYYGVQDVRASGKSPPFEFDALFRAVKWATRTRTGFSEKRGTTCCAFITACYQAAVIDNLAGGKREKVLAAYDYLKGERAAKLPQDVRVSQFETLGPQNKQKKVAFQPLRQYSNPGAKNKERTVDDYCKAVSEILCGAQKTVAQVFPPALIVDAKFNYSANFEKMVKAAHSGWTRLL